MHTLSPDIGGPGVIQRIGRYEILEEVGRGAMGVVYRARDPKINRTVAIKTITDLGRDSAALEEYRQRFFREAQAAGRLSHHGIVTIYDVHEDEATGTPYIVMEFIVGQTLDDLVKSCGDTRLPVATALEIVQQLAEALDYAHGQGIVHRDIKPANFLITAEGRAKITDFGIAKLDRSEFTTAGTLLGTPAYMSPEQIEFGTADGRSDLFSLGAILYWLLTGQRPFRGESPTEIVFGILSQESPPSSQLNPAVPAGCDYVVARTLAKNPALRYQRAGELAKDLEDLRRGQPPSSQSQDSPAEQGIEKTAFIAQVQSEVKALPRIIFADRSRQLAGWVQRWPREAQVAAGISLLFLIFLLVAKIGGSERSAKLQIQCEYNFRDAKIWIWADDEQVYKGSLLGAVTSGTERGERVHGSLAEIIRVTPERHLIRVRVSAPKEAYEQTKEARGEFIANRQRILDISFYGAARKLSLELR